MVGPISAPKVHVLCPPSYHFDIIRKEQCQCFGDISEVIRGKEKQESAEHCPHVLIIGRPNFHRTLDVSQIFGLIHTNQGVLENPIWNLIEFFFHLFICTISTSLQTSFKRVMKDWPDNYHEWYTSKRSLSRSNSRQFKHALHIWGVFIVFLS